MSLSDYKTYVVSPLPGREKVSLGKPAANLFQPGWTTIYHLHSSCHPHDWDTKHVADQAQGIVYICSFISLGGAEEGSSSGENHLRQGTRVPVDGILPFLSLNFSEERGEVTDNNNVKNIFTQTAFLLFIENVRIYMECIHIIIYIFIYIIYVHIILFI